MAFVRQGCALALSLTLWAVAALAEDQTPAAAGLYDRPVLVVDPGMHTAVIWRAAADQEGRWAGRWAVTGSDDKTVRVWSLEDGALLRDGHGSRVTPGRNPGSVVSRARCGGRGSLADRHWRRPRGGCAASGRHGGLWYLAS
jgi:hypothetical protein